MSDDEDLDRLERQAEDMRLQIARANAQLYDRKKHFQEQRRQYFRDYYAKNREQQLEYQRQYRAAQREKDPERFAELRRGRAKRWRDRHKEQENARQRAQYRKDPQPHKERRARYYAEHAEEIKAKRREYYAANKEKVRAAQQALRDREKSRRDAGLPVRRLHPVDPDQIRSNADAADEFFARDWSRTDLERIQHGPPTPPELWAAWKRDCLRARAAYHLAEQKEELARLQKELGRARPGPKPKPRPTAEEIEAERLDAIGRQINERLLRREPPRRPHHLDPAAPHPMLQPNHTMGMNR